MSESLEYRIADLKTTVAWLTVLALLTMVGVLAEGGAVAISLAVYFGTILIAIVVRGRDKDGICRRLAEWLLRKEYESQPLKDWKNDLKERGEL